MPKKYKEKEYIRVVKAICIVYGNIHNSWTWCFVDIKDALKKASKIIRRLEPDDRLSIGIKYCGQNIKTGEVLELIPRDDNVKINGVEYGDFETLLFEAEIAPFEDWPDGTPEHIFGTETD